MLIVRHREDAVKMSIGDRVVSDTVRLHDHPIAKYDDHRHYYIIFDTMVAATDHVRKHQVPRDKVLTQLLEREPSFCDDVLPAFPRADNKHDRDERKNEDRR